MLSERKLKNADIFGYPVCTETMDDLISYTLECIHQKKTLHVITINPEMITYADNDLEFARLIKETELVIPDGVGIELALKRAEVENAKRIAGIEFSEKLIEECSKAGHGVAFLGSTEDVCQKLQLELTKKYPKLNIVFLENGYYDKEEHLIEKLKKAKPKLILVGLGSPKQENFIKNYKNILNPAIFVGVGGSFDVWAKKVNRAPVFFRLFGIEWLYRLITQPKRFKRMFPVLPNFFLRILFGKKYLRKEY